ncbi:SDR family oxidoreductase [Aquimarina agarivorans]|uniref:SDR family oxidoreductase n=1 Tax=Aquimarina agarivorans TaxID=980584 RepID=UPI000248E6CE|nr:SDR family oxidoreductase [Aquimarina agarivorans]
MRVLITGANGYIGMRLLPLLIDNGFDVVCCVRDKNRLNVPPDILQQIEIVEIDFLDAVDTINFPKDIDVAYYLIHSMSSSTEDFDRKEALSAENFNKYMVHANTKHVVYLSGIVNENQLSKHLQSRKNVETILYKGKPAITVLRAGIIVGSGSSSFEIIRDLCEKLPFMITPKWVNTKTQPIGVRDVLRFLINVPLNEATYNQSFDIAGPNVITYKEMLQLYAKYRKLPLYIITVPVMTPKLSSYWLYFVTSTSYKLAVNLVDSMGVPVVAKDKKLQDLLGLKPMTYTKALKLAFISIKQNQVVSSWKDSMVSGRFKKDLEKYISVPTNGCLLDKKQVQIIAPTPVLERIWSIGGETGWYYGDWMWKIRGYIDKVFGGVGLRRGRTHANKIDSGDVIDFWRVLVADKTKKRLLLFAEMRLPGEAWLEFKIDDNNVLHQTATFRPKGLAGRIYWFSMLPFHYFIFNKMMQYIAFGRYSKITT